MEPTFTEITRTELPPPGVPATVGANLVPRPPEPPPPPPEPEPEPEPEPKPQPEPEPVLEGLTERTPGGDGPRNWQPSRLGSSRFRRRPARNSQGRPAVLHGERLEVRCDSCSAATKHA